MMISANYRGTSGSNLNLTYGASQSSKPGSHVLDYGIQGYSGVFD